MSRTAPKTVSAFAVLVLAAALLGYSGAAVPRLFLLFVGGIFVAALTAFAMSRPHEALGVAVLLILIAGTKFRTRDVMESSTVDAQVLMELALYGAVGLMMLAIWLFTPRAALRATAMDVMLAAYVVWAMASTAWSSEPKVTAVRSIQLLVLYVFAQTLIRVFEPKRVLQTLTAVLLPFVLIAPLVAWLLPGVPVWVPEYRSEMRFTWFGMHPISVAALVGLAILFLTAEALFSAGGWRRRRLALPLWLHAGILLMIFLATRSRAPTVALVVGLSALYLRRYGRPWTLPLFGAAAIAISVLVASGPSLAGVLRAGAERQNPVTNFIYRNQDLSQIEGLNGREALWSGAWSVFEQRPWLGHGFQASRNQLLEIMPWAGHAHNALLEGLLDVGIIGTLLLWLPVSLAFLRRAFERRHPDDVWVYERTTILALICFMVVNAVGDASFAGTASFDPLLMMTCIFAGERLAATPTPVRERLPAEPVLA